MTSCRLKWRTFDLATYMKLKFRDGSQQDRFKIVTQYENETLIRPIVSCGAEAWTLTKKEEQAVLIFERKIFRRIYGPKYENGEWKSRTNQELEEMREGKNIVKMDKRAKRISWLGVVWSGSMDVDKERRTSCANF